MARRQQMAIARSRVFLSPTLANYLDRRLPEMSPEAQAVYLVSLLIADENGRFTKTALNEALDELGGSFVWYERLADGATRVCVFE
jgi:hypothetical protein